MTRPPDQDELVHFARLVSHGLRNPLAIATGMLDLLARQVGDELDEDRRELIDRSAVALRRAGELVLALQRYVGAARDPLSPAPVDLAAVLGDAAAEVDLGGATLAAAGELPTVVADAEALQRMLRELLRNAGQAAATTITVSARAGDEGATVVVDDDGPGIDAAQRAAAFTEGERLGRTGDGFGLGLPTVRTLAQRHGGDVHLEDSPSGGLRVVVRLGAAPPASLGQQRA